MAIFDALFEFCDNATLVGSSTTDYNASTANELDWVAADLEMGAGTPIWLNIRVGATAYTPTTSGDTVKFALYADGTSSGHDSDSNIVMTSDTIATSALTAGAWILRAPLPVNCDEERYLQIGATFNEATTAGTIDAWLDHGPQSSYDTQVSASNIS